ncbi:MAG TPA: hypothetical protein VGQ18_11055 [Gemmatimonadales bacterium]|jgi:hypothetical protein|nr:hypothetical protein [Gemmatimonadales bacterium]
MVAAPALALNLLLLAAQSASQDTTGAAARLTPLDSSGIREAIALGRQTKRAYGFSSSAWGSAGFLATTFKSNYVIYAQGPFGRVATAAAKAARNYQSFTADSVQADMIAPVLTVIAYPDILDPGENKEISVSPERVVLQTVTPAGDTVIVQPMRMDTVASDYANLFGAKITRSGLIATFDLRAGLAPPFDIIIVNPAKEARLKVRAKDLPKLR